MGDKDYSLAVNAVMQMLNRNIATMDDKASLSISDAESMNTLSRLERDIVLADPQSISEELQTLMRNNKAEAVMKILEKDLQSIGIDCSWSKNSKLSLRSGDTDLVISPESKLDVVETQENLQLMVGQALQKTHTSRFQL